MSCTNARPFLRWAGSKRQLLPALSSFWNDSHERYVEPFAGSACLFFRLHPKTAILGDINSELIRTYIEIKYRVDGVARRLARYRTGQSEYARIRKTDPETLDATTRAARFIYLNRFCFNGLYRTNRSGQFNVPYGGEKSGALPTLSELKRCSLLLRRAILVPGDFERTLKLVRGGDFVYMDPPFRVDSRRIFNEYDASVFAETEICRLRHWMVRLANQNISFVVSYAESSEAYYLRDGFESRIVTVRRSIAGFTDSRARSRELLIWFAAPPSNRKACMQRTRMNTRQCAR
jgi:DNA adenine methylase